MRDILIIVGLGAAILLAWFIFKKDAKANESNAPALGGGCESLPPDLREKCLQGKNAPVKLAANINAGAAGAAIARIGENVILNNPAIRLTAINPGLASNYTGNGALEFYTGNGSLEYYQGKPVVPGRRPSCWSLWFDNINNPNSTPSPIVPGLTCSTRSRL